MNSLVSVTANYVWCPQNSELPNLPEEIKTKFKKQLTLLLKDPGHLPCD